VNNDDDHIATVLKPPKGELFEGTGFGLGNYDESLYWQQVRGFRKALVAHLAFADTLHKRAIAETKLKLAKEGFSYVNDRQETKKWKAWDELDDGEKAESKWADCDGQTLQQRGEEIWSDMASPFESLTEEQRAALKAKAGVDDRFVSVFESLQDMRHEGSRSKGARLLDNFTTAAQVLRQDASGLEVE
jgi:hypothetical protein